MRHAEARRRLSREYFYVFWWWYFAHYHGRQIPAYKVPTFNAARDPRLLVIEPRDHGKSAAWSCGYPLWVALTNPFNRPAVQLPGGGFRYEMQQEEVVTQISAAGRLPRKWIKRHQRELQYNQLLIEDWGYQVTANQRGGAWSSEEIVLQNGAHLFSMGAGAQVRGQHPTRIVVDDLESREDSKNPDLREKMQEYFWADLYGALERESTMVVIGTIVHPQSLLVQLHDKDILDPAGKPEQWTKFRFQAELPDGTPLAPEIWPRERLAARKAVLLTHKPEVWYMEHQNRPRVSLHPIFPETWFNREHNHYDSRAELFRDRTVQGLRKLSFMDPNIGRKQTDDWTAIVTVGYRREEKTLIYVLDVKQFRSTGKGKMRELIRSWEKWRGRVGVEAVAFASLLSEFWDELVEELNYHIDYYTTIYREEPVEGAPPPKELDKVSRAEWVQCFFEENQLRFDYNDPKHVKLIDELKLFTGAEKETNDQVDALVGCLWEIKRELAAWKAEQENKITPSYDADTGEPSYLYDGDSRVEW